MITFSTEVKLVAGALDKLKGFYIHHLIFFLIKLLFYEAKSIGSNKRVRRDARTTDQVSILNKLIRMHNDFSATISRANLL